MPFQPVVPALRSDLDPVAHLLDGRVLLDFAHALGCALAAKTDKRAGGGPNPCLDLDRTGRAGVHDDVARAAPHLQLERPRHHELPVESALDPVGGDGDVARGTGQDGRQETGKQLGASGHRSLLGGFAVSLRRATSAEVAAGPTLSPSGGER
jgi:hypothetical protein